MASMTPTRAARREDVTARVLEIGRRHLAEHGAAGLSLRAVTRELGMVSSAVYRYVANRDELLTLLLVDAYDDQADAVDSAVASVGDRPWDVRLLAAAAAFRAWAVREPSRYALLYGSPVPGYAAPAERTTEPGTRVIGTLLGLVAEGVARGDVPDGPAPLDPQEPLAADLRRVTADVGLDVHPAVLARAVLLWATIVGGTSLEVFGQYGPDAFTTPALLLDAQVRMALDVLRGRCG
jgi:AcrR family transcriptional regulator